MRVIVRVQALGDELADLEPRRFPAISSVEYDGWRLGRVVSIEPTHDGRYLELELDLDEYVVRSAV